MVDTRKLNQRSSQAAGVLLSTPEPTPTDPDKPPVEPPGPDKPPVMRTRHGR